MLLNQNSRLQFSTNLAFRLFTAGHGTTGKSCCSTALTHPAMARVRKSDFCHQEKTHQFGTSLWISFFLLHSYLTRLYSISSTTFKFFLQWEHLLVQISGQIKFPFLVIHGTKNTREPVPFCMYSLTLSHDAEVLQWNIFVPLPVCSRGADLCI